MRLRLALILAALTGSASTTSVAVGGPSLRYSVAIGSVEVTDLDPARMGELKALRSDDPRWTDILSVRLGRDPGQPEAGPIVGRVEVDGSTLRFTPQYPLKAGTRYLARYRQGETTIQLTFSTATRPAGPATSIVAVDPSVDLVPENLLKVYVRFSGPMSRGEAYTRVRVLNDMGHPIERPFLEIGEELWDPSQTRLTLLFDPGRIKRGLKPREEEGPILESGKTYTLTIDRAWPDAEGHPLRDGFRKPFRAGRPDDVQPDPSRWTLGIAPKPGTTTPLIVGFPEPLDRAMLGWAIEVRVGGLAVAGKVEVADGERTWRFIPDRPWPPGAIALRVDTELEDLAGNSVARPFETVMVRDPTKGARPRFVTVTIPGRP